MIKIGKIIVLTVFLGGLMEDTAFCPSKCEFIGESGTNLGYLAIRATPQKPLYRVLMARITRYNPSTEKGELPINHRGKRIINKKGGCAVPKNTLSDGTKIIIPAIGDKMFIVDDRIPNRSVKRLERRAEKQGIDIDICLDLRYYKDMGYQEVWVYDTR
jgi:hypothetical protein